MNSLELLIICLLFGASYQSINIIPTTKYITRIQGRSLVTTCMNDPYGVESNVKWLDTSGKTLNNSIGRKRVSLNKSGSSPSLDLIITEVKPADAGVYTCAFAKSLNKIISKKKFTLRIIPPVNFTNIPNRVIVNEKDPALLECMNPLKPKPHNVVWFHNQSRIFNSMKHNINPINPEKLIINSTNYSDGGLYTCQIHQLTADSLITSSNKIELKIINPISHNGTSMTMETNTSNQARHTHSDTTSNYTRLTLTLPITYAIYLTLVN